MNSQEATKLFSKYSVLLCLDVPVNGYFEIGIDLNSWTAGPMFKGIKLIPPGIHFVFYSMASQHGGCSAPRTGFFLNAKTSEVFVYRWSPESEELIALTREEASPYIQSVRNYEFDSNLGAYPIESLKLWNQINNFISPSVLSKIQPISKNIIATNKVITPSESRQLDEALENMGVEEEKREAELKKFTVQSRSFFSSIPLAPKYADPKDLTAYHMDKSLLLETLVQREYDGNPNGLLGEIQYAFIIFLLAQVYEGFEQWKTLVTLVLSCERAIYDSNYVKFFKNFLIAIRKQLKHINEDFFVEPISETFLQYHLKSFFDCLDEGTNIDHDLISAATKLKSFVKKKFRMNFELVLNDEAPVVVEIEEDKLST